ncbi:MAG: hypothetical protein QOJ06_2276 [Pseudonocardiales bacterium]|nr:hypothetical protein [Pseudonocardiales bacterium]
MSTARWSAAGDISGCCPSCGRCAESTAEACALRVELATTWLIVEAGVGAVVAVRSFCRACAPVGPVGDVACTVCADGPLLAGKLASGTAGDVVDTWLDEHGWRLTAGAGGEAGALLCPGCARFAAGTSRVVRDDATAWREVEVPHDGQGRWALW